MSYAPVGISGDHDDKEACSSKTTVKTVLQDEEWKVYFSDQ